MSWTLLKPSAERDLKKLSNPQLQIVVDKISRLREEPFPPQSRKLKGHPGYRLRVGDYRVLYEVDTRIRTVTLYAVGHRREVYR